MGLDFRNTFHLERAWFTGEALSPEEFVKRWKRTTASLQVRAIQFLKSRRDCL